MLTLWQVWWDEEVLVLIIWSYEFCSRIGSEGNFWAALRRENSRVRGRVSRSLLKSIHGSFNGGWLHITSKWDVIYFYWTLSIIPSRKASNAGTFDQRSGFIYGLSSSRGYFFDGKSNAGDAARRVPWRFVRMFLRCETMKKNQGGIWGKTHPKHIR